MPHLLKQIHSFSIGPYLTARGILDVYENSVIFTSPIKFSTPEHPPAREKSDINGFSPAARRRMMKMFSMVEYSRYNSPLFVSATFHFDFKIERLFLKKTLDNFLKRLKRQLPEFHHIWKLELQKREAPHFHFMILFTDKSKKINFKEAEEIIKKNWLDLKLCDCKHCEQYAIKTKMINDYKHAMIYISKEIAKITQNKFCCDIGNYWNHSRKIYIRKYESFNLSISEMKEITLEFLNTHPQIKLPDDFKNRILNEPYSYSLFTNIDDIAPSIKKIISEKISNKIFFDKNNITKFAYNKLLLSQ